MADEIEEFLDKRDESGSDDDTGMEEDTNVWMRGLFMLILAVLFAVAETVLCVFAVLQFLWLLFSKKRNGFLADTGDKFGNWLAAVARYQTAATDEKPFPWRKLD